ncbi:hypothetical protein GCM10027419_36740 [Pandoraea terrae]
MKRSAKAGDVAVAAAHATSSSVERSLARASSDMAQDLDRYEQTQAINGRCGAVGAWRFMLAAA